MDPQGLAGVARRRLRSTEAGTLEIPASGVAGRRTPFVLTHEGRPVLAGEGLAAGEKARLRVDASPSGAEPGRVVVEGRLRAASPAEAERFAAFLPGVPALLLEPESVRVSGAAGDASLRVAEFLLPEPAWKAEEPGIVAHMNQDHEDSMLRMSLHYHGVEAASARLVAVDPEGLHVRTERGVLYFPFDRRCATQEDVHQATVQLARTARLALAKAGR